MLSQEIIRPEADLSDVNITRIRPLNETELLVATEGMGVYKLDMNKCILERYISANYQSYNEMNGDNINDVFVDESKRIWLANYPTGITVIDYRYENYHWMKHSMGNKQSISMTRCTLSLKTVMEIYGLVRVTALVFTIRERENGILF